jgi:NADH-quinone oxidoreductase subunit J
MTLDVIGFLALATLTLAGAFGAVIQANLTRALLAVIVFFLGIAGLFFTLHAEMLGAVQILVYVGAVAVMMVYAIVLTRPADGGEEKRGSFSWFGALVSALVGALLVGAVLRSTPSRDLVAAAPTEGTAELAELMLITYALPFEVASLLLTGALVGAVVLALDEIKKRNTGGGRA